MIFTGRYVNESALWDELECQYCEASASAIAGHDVSKFICHKCERTTEDAFTSR